MSEMSVYKKLKAEKVLGKYNKDHSVVIREKMIITDDYAKGENTLFKSTGIYYKRIESHEAYAKKMNAEKESK